MLTLLDQAHLFRAFERACLALRDHARACARCARAERYCSHTLAYCDVGREFIRRWRRASRRLQRR